MSAQTLHFSAWGRGEVKVRIEAGHGVDLAHRHIDPARQLLQLIRRQVAELLLDRPELVEQGASSPLSPAS